MIFLYVHVLVKLFQNPVTCNDNNNHIELMAWKYFGNIKRTTVPPSAASLTSSPLTHPTMTEWSWSREGEGNTGFANLCLHKIFVLSCKHEFDRPW